VTLVQLTVTVLVGIASGDLKGRTTDPTRTVGDFFLLRRWHATPLQFPCTPTMQYTSTIKPHHAWHAAGKQRQQLASCQTEDRYHLQNLFLLPILSVGIQIIYLECSAVQHKEQHMDFAEDDH
jgi:hypothetical protein